MESGWSSTNHQYNFNQIHNHNKRKKKNRHKRNDNNYRNLSNGLDFDDTIMTE